MQQETIDIIRSVFEGFAETSDNSYMFICDLNRRFSRWSKNAEAYFDHLEKHAGCRSKMGRTDTPG